MGLESDEALACCLSPLGGIFENKLYLLKAHENKRNKVRCKNSLKQMQCDSKCFSDTNPNAPYLRLSTVNSCSISPMRAPS
jgi:hypothetical protein